MLISRKHCLRHGISNICFTAQIASGHFIHCLFILLDQLHKSIGIPSLGLFYKPHAGRLLSVSVLPMGISPLGSSTLAVYFEPVHCLLHTLDESGGCLGAHMNIFIIKRDVLRLVLTAVSHPFLFSSYYNFLFCPLCRRLSSIVKFWHSCGQFPEGYPGRAPIPAGYIPGILSLPLGFPEG